jgi:hypothetical protein
MKPIFQQGDKYSDERGYLRFVNETSPGNYRRFYIITHLHSDIVRAWQGHLHEEKAFFAINGHFIIAVISPSSFKEPEDNEKPDFFHLNSLNNDFLRVPGGNYTGIKALSSNSSLLVLSSSELNESKKDDYRQPVNRWVNWDLLT